MSDLSDIRMRAQNKTDSLWKPHQSVFGSPNSQTKNIDSMTSSDRSLRQQLEFTTQQNKNLQKSVNSMLSKIFQLEEQLASNPQKYKQGEAKQAPVELNELRTLEQQYEKQLYNMMQDKDQQIAQLKSQNDEQANQFIKKIRQLDIEILKNCDTHQGQIAKYKEEITQYICEQAQMTQKLNGLQQREQYLAEKNAQNEIQIEQLRSQMQNSIPTEQFRDLQLQFQGQMQLTKQIQSQLQESQTLNAELNMLSKTQQSELNKQRAVIQTLDKYINDNKQLILHLKNQRQAALAEKEEEINFVNQKLAEQKYFQLEQSKQIQKQKETIQNLLTNLRPEIINNKLEQQVIEEEEQYKLILQKEEEHTHSIETNVEEIILHSDDEIQIIGQLLAQIEAQEEVNTDVCAENHELHHQINSLNEQIRSYLETKQTLNLMIDQLQNKNTDQRNELNLKVEQIKKLNAEINEAHAEQYKSQNELLQLQKILDMKEIQHQQYKELIDSQLKAVMDEYNQERSVTSEQKQEISQLNQTIKHQLSDISGLERQISDSQSKTEQLNELVSQLKHSLEQLGAQRQLDTIEVQNLKEMQFQQLQQKQKQIDDIHNEFDKSKFVLEHQIQQLTSEMNQAKQDAKNYFNQSQQLGDLKTKHEQQIQELEFENKDLQGLAENMNKQINSHLEKIQALEFHVGVLQNENKKFDEELAKTVNNLTNSRSQDQYMEKSSMMQKSFKDKEISLIRTQEQQDMIIKKQQKQIFELEAQITELMNQSPVQNQKCYICSEKDVKIHMLEQLKSELQLQIQVLTEKIQEVSSKKLETENQLKQQINQQAKLKRDNSFVEDDLKMSINNLKDRVAELQYENQQLQNQKQKLERIQRIQVNGLE
ncbi:Hypothetical_protein [Hexamita inflata]|uniref:Hypothetical_protein n=1 Tax=Hexamita inflata TaxID=28002 RepID=A0AA86RDI2_9EUKA|nr:Hypothetical protein HINF_LOCUS63591 [Hexamita inflata]